MAVSKRTRFEVLRRDNYACRYCGASAPDVKLTVDHVMPLALGGSDKPDNLVAACVDCNAGKSSSVPDESVAEQVSEDAARWAVARDIAMREWHAERDQIEEVKNEFLTYWLGSDTQLEFLPDNWGSRIEYWLKRGAWLVDILDALSISLGAENVAPRHKFRYMSGVINNWLEDIDSRALCRVRGELNGA